MLTTPVPGAVDLARSLAIDLARQRVLTETASSKNHQQRLDQAFSAIKAFEHAHSFTPIHDIKGSSNELDKINVAANIRRNSSSQSLGDHNHTSLHGSPNVSFTGKFVSRLSLHDSASWPRKQLYSVQPEIGIVLPVIFGLPA